VLLIVNGFECIIGSVSSFKLFRHAAEIAIALGAFLIAWILIQIYWIHALDVPVEVNSKTKTSSIVTLYIANVCPFCPIVRNRLVELQKNMEFILNEIDIIFKPKILKEKGFSSVPLIEISGEYWNANATSSELYSFITKNDQIGA